jgi:hypothetical protein
LTMGSTFGLPAEIPPVAGASHCRQIIFRRDGIDTVIFP